MNSAQSASLSPRERAFGLLGTDQCQSPAKPNAGEGTRSIKLRTPGDVLDFARSLRKHQTNAEELMWFLLRGRRFLDLKFRRQHAVGPYVVDFYCDAIRLAVELDGGHHDLEAEQARDRIRDDFLVARGLEVVRYWNQDVIKKTEDVLEDLMQRIQARARSLTPTPLPGGEGNQSFA